MIKPADLNYDDLKKEIEKIKKREGLNWRELNYEFEEMIKYCKIVENQEITEENISQLYDKGWRLDNNYSCSVGGRCNRKGKRIILDKDLKEYNRDEILFHEIVHAFYPYLDDKDSSWNKEAFHRTVILEYMARNLRANPRMLRHTINTFGLKPEIYDKTSLIAFTPFSPEQLERQIPFSFAKDYFDYLKARSTFTMMDASKY